MSNSPLYLLPGVGPTTITLGRRLDMVVPFEDFLAEGYNPATDDCAPALVAAAAWSAANDRTVLFAGHYSIENCATIPSDGARFHFEDAVFDVYDNGTSGTLTNGMTGKIGILFKLADRLSVTGSARFIGKGTLGQTRLMGVVFDTCHQAIAPAVLYFETMAAGRATFFCEHGLFGDVLAFQMNGLQPLDGSNFQAGTADLVGSCNSCIFGRVDAKANWKPCRYLTKIHNSQGQLVDNIACSFGWVQGTPARNEQGVASLESSCLAIRSGRNCHFDGCGGEGFSVGVHLVRYNGDEGLTVDGNVIDAVTGYYSATGASVDAAIAQDAESTAVPIGSNVVGQVQVVCDGEFGVFVSTGALSIGFLSVTGKSTPPTPALVRAVTAFNCVLRIETAEFSRTRQEAVTIGQSCSFSADLIDLRSGSLDGVTAAIRYNPAYGTGGFGQPIVIQQIRYRQNAVGTNYLYLILDQANGPESWVINHIDGQGSGGQAFLANADTYSVKFGKYGSAAKPTAGTFTPGFFVWNTAPAIDANSMTLLGWSRLTAGSGHVAGTDWAIARTSVVSPAT